MAGLFGKADSEKTGVSRNTVSTDISKQPSEIYFIEINNNGALLREKFVRE